MSGDAEPVQGGLRTQSSAGAIASVVIPAHDEEQRIGANLRSLLADARPGEFDVVVVCNGCSDRTAEAARQVPAARVAEIEAASKIAALREGDRLTRVFPRIYLDADVVLTTAAARAIVEALRDPRPRVAGVPGSYDLSDASLPVRLFYEFRQRLPVFREGVIGAGVYAMNLAGRQRFGEWPEVLADDQFIYRLFQGDERETVHDYHTIVEPPSTLRDEMRRGVRVRRGIAQLSRGSDDVAPLPAPRAGVRSALHGSVRSPRGIASAVVFTLTTIIVRFRTKLGRRGDWTSVSAGRVRRGRR